MAGSSTMGPQPSPDPAPMWREVRETMARGLAEGVFPGAVLLVSREGRVLFHEAFGVANRHTQRPMTTDTAFDLASLTKPLATTLAVMDLAAKGRLRLEDTLGDILYQWRGHAHAHIQIRHLLCHRAGFADYRPYFETLRRLPLAQRKQALRRLLLDEPLLTPVNTVTRYSDIGFMVLEWVVEEAAGCSLDQKARRSVYDPLQIKDLFFIDLQKSIPDRPFAATEVCPWRGLTLSGMVHDDNAYVLGGVAGHAGLFGTAAGVHALLAALLEAWRSSMSPVFDPALVRRFFTIAPGAERALGFDAPSKICSSSGVFFDRTATIGHLGFTGVSFWMELLRGITVILLTNRVHPTRANEAIKTFRPRIHNAVMKPFSDMSRRC